AITGAALAKLGILDEIKGKTRHAALAVGGELVAKGEVELGFFNLSEIPKGVTVAGALPAPLQGYTAYEAAVLSKGSTAEAVTAFVKYLAALSPLCHRSWGDSRRCGGTSGWGRAGCRVAGRCPTLRWRRNPTPLRDQRLPTATASVGLIVSGQSVSLIVAEDFQGFHTVAPSRAIAAQVLQS